MENTTASPTLSHVTRPRQNIATAALRRSASLLIAGLKHIGAAWSDPMMCSAFWIGGIPQMWDNRK